MVSWCCQSRSRDATTHVIVRSRASTERQLQTLEAAKTLSDGSIRRGIKLSAFSVSKESVDRVKDALS